MSALELICCAAFFLTLFVGVVVCWSAVKGFSQRKPEEPDRSEERFRSRMMAGFAILGGVLWAPWLSTVLPHGWSWIAVPESGLLAGLFVGYWVAKLSAVF